jgi:hypothetical protein
LKEQPHKWYWDYEKSNSFVKGSGYTISFMDHLFGLSLDDLDGMSIRQQREIIKHRVRNMQM